MINFFAPAYFFYVINELNLIKDRLRCGINGSENLIIYFNVCYLFVYTCILFFDKRRKNKPRVRRNGNGYAVVWTSKLRHLFIVKKVNIARLLTDESFRMNESLSSELQF